MQTQEYGQLKLSDEEKERETVFGLMIERQHSEPSDKNKESLFLAMKDARQFSAQQQRTILHSQNHLFTIRT